GLIVVSAGNVEDEYSVANNDVQPRYPSSYDCDNIISVCNVDWNDQLANSHYGATSVDLAAPGKDIYSTLPNGLYGEDSGTSMAAPYVTGVAALIWSVNPNLTPAQVKAAILNSVDPVAGLSGKCVTGGRLNAYKALTYALTEYDSDALTGDINGDGREDLLFYRGLNSKRRFTVFYGKADGSFEQASTYYFSASSYSPSNQVFLGDVNGDGKKEVIVHWSADSYRKFTVYTYSAASDSFTAARLNSTRLHNPTAYPNKFFVADVDGDQKEDFIVHWRTDAGKRKNLVYKGLIRTDGLACFAEGIDSAESTRTYVDTDPVFVGDVNGDGRSDLVIHWALNAKRQLLTYTANSDGTFSEAVNFSSTRTHNAAAYPCRLLLEDVNGDNKEDFIVHWKNAQDRRCFLVYNGTVSSGKATFQEGRDVLYSTRTFDENDAVYTGDFNGDGRTDLLVHWEMDLKRQLLIYFANSSGEYNEGVNISTPQNFVPWDYPYSAYVLDANGDNKDDFVVRWTYGTLTSNEYGYNHTHTYKGNASGVDATVQTTMIYSPFYDYRA
ncbi:MAG: VCBS repeat-containing protein, partial [Clostridia bacterium]|nr:VCBS repeat-containing protein [Clostridia bacterium]